MVDLSGWIIGMSRERPDPFVVAEITAIRRELDELTVHATADGNTLKARIKTLGPSHAKEVLLASVLRLLQSLEAEAKERGRALGRSAR